MISVFGLDGAFACADGGMQYGDLSVVQGAALAAVAARLRVTAPTSLPPRGVPV